MNIKPTDSELEILQILWQKRECTVREVNEILSEERGEEVGYTTTLKLMQIMHEKGMVERDTSSRTHIYKALMNPERTRNSILNKVIDTVFNGSASQLVMQALSNRKSSKEEIEQIKKYLDQLDKK
ncbi:putative transcriptional regulator [Arcticibacter tournemirensis]|uniref:BlaI/MecI/CopY family transcriptional regulator n=1 Tax=Arcticibacter tournemirensis TaxID=699437 RepID=A0A4Q0MBJ3_9SPHI|nr:BlaI/MecI/CopY family transcriptional regulator [Arcticibacter tournemirensis]KAA8483365.1 BlaI/MecI/CopY family transcriptional regulator [Arcticibacter tournemirensis]RXF70688.1 BlaI/MecI/CopY family transcriptional regulator [Arcticibacter tournemirensis]TQM50945.1 putative transcriptional regulator [Arcticibacter tournemirensis]